MTPLEFSLLAFLVSILAGVLGALLGLGGGIIVVPALTLLMGIDIRYAIGASIVSVIATSSGAAAAYVREHLTNLRVGMFLELATTSGALTGAFLAGIARRTLALRHLRRRARGVGGCDAPTNGTVRAAYRRRTRWADRLRLHGSFYDPATRKRSAIGSPTRSSAWP